MKSSEVRAIVEFETVMSVQVNFFFYKLVYHCEVLWGSKGVSEIYTLFSVDEIGSNTLVIPEENPIRMGASTVAILNPSPGVFFKVSSCASTARFYAHTHNNSR
jgi:hypothetical protein